MMSDGDSSTHIIEPCASPSSPDHDHQSAPHPLDSFPAPHHYHDHHQFLQTMISANHPELPWLASLNSQSNLDDPSHEKNLQNLLVAADQDARCCRLITNCRETLPDHLYCESEPLRYSLSAIIDENDAGAQHGSFRNTGNSGSFDHLDHRVLSMASDGLPDVSPFHMQSLIIRKANDAPNPDPSPAQSLIVHKAGYESNPTPSAPPVQFCIRNADDLMCPHEDESILINAEDDLLQLLQPYSNNNTANQQILIHEGASGAAPSNHECIDLDEVLDILLQKVECSASASPCMGPSLISTSYGLGISDAANNHKRASEAALKSPRSSNKAMKDRHGEPADLGWPQAQAAEGEKAIWQDQYPQEGRARCQQEEGGETRASWQQQEEGHETRTASWQQQYQDGEIRAGCWQQIQAGEDRASRQQNEAGEARASWQEVERRGNWQQKQGRTSDEVEAGEEQAADEGGKDLNDALNAWMQSCSGEYMSINASHKPAWAGPTLMDIQLALATSCASPITASANTSPDDSSPAASLSLQQDQETQPLPTQDKTSSLLTDEVAQLCNDDLEQAQKLKDSWRARLQKRGNIGPKYTVRVRSEEEAARDGYRWRKYGQKSIKNSPFPRCYYKCTTGNCLVKKQVERCTKDSKVFIVTYEGLHVHTRPDVCHMCASSSNFPHSQCQSTL